MKSRGRRFLRPARARLRVLAENRQNSQRSSADRSELCGCLRFDVLDEMRDPLAICHLIQVRPTREWRELEALFRGVLEGAKILLSFSRGVFRGAIEPLSADRLSSQGLPQAVYAWPVASMSHEALLHAVRKEIAESLDLSAFLRPHQDGPITLVPHIGPPLLARGGAVKGRTGKVEAERFCNPW